MEPLSRSFLAGRGVCCGNGCENCPYEPQHEKGSVELRKWEPPTVEDVNAVFGDGDDPIRVEHRASKDVIEYLEKLNRIYRKTRESTQRFDR